MGQEDHFKEDMPKMPVLQERTTEYNLGELLQDAWTLYSKKFALIAVAILIISVPLHIVLTALPGNNINDAPNFQEYFSLDASTYPEVSGLAVVIAILGTLVGIIIPFSVAIATRAAKEGRNATAMEVVREAFQKWGKGILTMLILAVLLMILYILLIIPGIIFTVYWIFVPIIVALTGTYGLEALSASKKLVVGRWWRLLGYGIMFGIITALAGMVVGAILTAAGSNYVTNVLGNIAYDIISGFSVVGLTLLYLNLKDRQKESMPA